MAEIDDRPKLTDASRALSFLRFQVFPHVPQKKLSKTAPTSLFLPRRRPRSRRDIHSFETRWSRRLLIRNSGRWSSFRRRPSTRPR
jgi:hypothetical protein